MQNFFRNNTLTQEFLRAARYLANNAQTHIASILAASCMKTITDSAWLIWYPFLLSIDPVSSVNTITLILHVLCIYNSTPSYTVQNQLLPMFEVIKRASNRPRGNTHCSPQVQFRALVTAFPFKLHFQFSFINSHPSWWQASSSTGMSLTIEGHYQHSPYHRFLVVHRILQPHHFAAWLHMDPIRCGSFSPILTPT